jgi:hypothetical protein
MPQDLIQARTLESYTLRARDGELGGLVDLYFDDVLWRVRYLVARTGGWLAGREVLLLPEKVAEVDRGAGVITLDLTRQAVEESPPVGSEKPVSRQYEAQYYQYWGLMGWWETFSFPGPATGPGLGVEPPVPPPASLEAGADEARRQHERNPDLRSLDEVRGYHIHATDDSAGHVSDALVEPEAWRLRYLEVSTRNWLPGRHVLVAPAWIESVSWVDREVRVAVSREALRTAPPYDPDRPLTRDDELALYRHYGLEEP